MRILGNSLLVLSVLVAISAVWLISHWWQLLITAAFLFFLGAAILGGSTKTTHRKGLEL